MCGEEGRNLDNIEILSDQHDWPVGACLAVGRIAVPYHLAAAIRVMNNVRRHTKRCAGGDRFIVYEPYTCLGKAAVNNGILPLMAQEYVGSNGGLRWFLYLKFVINKEDLGV